MPGKGSAAVITFGSLRGRWQKDKMAFPFCLLVTMTQERWECRGVWLGTGGEKGQRLSDLGNCEGPIIVAAKLYDEDRFGGIGKRKISAEAAASEIPRGGGQVLPAC